MLKCLEDVKVTEECSTFRLEITLKVTLKVKEKERGGIMTALLTSRNVACSGAVS